VSRVSPCPDQLKLDYKPVTRVENFCATGSEAFRNACNAATSGVYDTAMAIGAEKRKDTGYSGLTGIRSVGDGTDRGLSSPAAFCARCARCVRELRGNCGKRTRRPIGCPCHNRSDIFTIPLDCQ
jgi:acetyl-CoA acetyltransferase